MPSDTLTPSCPLCQRGSPELFYESLQRAYLRCDGCRLVFVPEPFWLSLEAEKATYDLHNNDTDDPGYRTFLSRLSRPLLERLGSHKKGLDFGCGPGPTLALMLEAEGHRVDLFDPFYHDDPEVFSKTYDFICATEVVEHLRDPAHVFDTIFKLLRSGGLLGIMTKRVTGLDAFRQWHYIRDPTHICFFCETTFEYMQQRFNAALEVVDRDVVLFQKRA